MKFIAGNAQHIGARPQQQDAFGFSDPGDPKFVAHAGFLGVVADGMGGLTHGSEASRSAVLAFLSAYRRKSVGESIPKALTRCLGEANTGVLRVAQNVPAGEEVGTTLVAAVLHDRILYWVSVGDSRIYLLRGSTLTQVTADHVYARELNRQVAAGKISLQEALNHPERSSLTSYLGQSELAHVDKNIRPLQVRDDDCVMLCSDGFYRALTEPELVAGLRSNPQVACDSLLGQALAKHRKQQDNLTVIALKRHTRTPIPRAFKLAFAATAMLLMISSGGLGYWIAINFQPPLPPTIPAPLPPSFALDKTIQPQAHGNRGAGGDAVNNVPNPQPSPKPTPPQKATDGASKKNGTGNDGKKATTPPPAQPPAGEGTAPPGEGKATQPPPARSQDTGNTQDKSGSTPTGPQDQQNQTGQTQTPGTAPAAPANPATPAQPNEEKKKDSATPPAKDRQPESPPAPQKDNQSDPSQPPKTSVVEGHTQIEG